MRKRCEFFVEGEPKTQGSKQSAGNRLIESAGKPLKTWRQLVHHTAQQQRIRFDGAVVVQVGFHLRRPRADFRKDGSLSPKADELHVKLGDLDKYTRAVLDSLTSSKMIVDDRYVVELHLNKWWSDDDVTGCKIVVDEA